MKKLKKYSSYIYLLLLEKRKLQSLKLSYE